MKERNKTLVFIALLLLVGCVSGNVTDDREYLTEDTSIPFEIWVLLFGIGLAFLLISAIVGFTMSNAGLTMVVGIIAFGFLATSAYAAPVTGFYSYISNTTTNASTQATPIVWGVFQPWMMWLNWGLATLAFLMFVLGVLGLFAERAHEEEMYWV